MEILLTQYDGAILGPIAKFIGFIMDYLYKWLSYIGIENVGVTIFALTFVIYMLMIPLTYRQQKFARIQKIMQPEIKEIQAKYKGKTDQTSKMAVQTETQEVYSKYGVSMVGSCLPLLVQMPIFFALYRVIYNIPAYVTGVKDLYIPSVNQIMAKEGYADSITGLIDKLNIARLKPDFTAASSSNDVIDFLYKVTGDGWDKVASAFPDASSALSGLQSSIHTVNNFLGLDVSYSPFDSMKNAFADGNWIIVILALLVPIIAGASQFANMKLTSASNSPGVGDDAVGKQMKTMNAMMPLVSVFMTFTLPIGLGIYWIAGAVVRIIQQLIMNYHLNKIDIEALIEKNAEKASQKNAKKKGYAYNQLSKAAKVNTRNIADKENTNSSDKTQESSKVADSNSMASKANAVREFNSRNNK